MAKVARYSLLSLCGIVGAKSDCCDRLISDTITRVLSTDPRIVGMTQFIRATIPVETTHCTELVNNFGADSMSSASSARIQDAILSHVSNDHPAVARGVYKYLRLLTRTDDYHRYSKKRLDCSQPLMFDHLDHNRNSLNLLLDWLLQLGQCI